MKLPAGLQMRLRLGVPFLCLLAAYCLQAPPSGQVPNILPERTVFLALPGQASPFGAGLLVRGGGLVLTCHHLVGFSPLRNARSHPQILVSYGDHRGLARMIAAEPDLDLALLLGTGPVNPELSDLARDERIWAARHELRPGQFVFATGSPFGLSATTLAGTIAHTGRRLPVFREMPLIQVSGPGLPGMDGAPLFLEDGRVAGLLIGAVPGVAGGIGFAIPAGFLRAFMESTGRFDSQPGL